VEDGLLAVNPAFKPGISKRRRINPLTREEISTLLETAKTMEIDPEIETSLTTVSQVVYMEAGVLA
jgi:hypothetical protein